MNETSWQQEREISKARHSDFWMSLYREAEMMNDEDNLEEYSWSIDPDIVRLADQCADLRAQLAAMTARKDGWRRVAKAYRSNVFVTNSELREWSLLRRIERREARNGHTD